MESKSRSSITHSRGTCVCDYCGLKLNIHNLKAHTQNVHSENPVKERVVSILSLNQFVHRFYQSDPKHLIQMFMINEELLNGIEIIIQACVVGSMY